MSRWAYTTLALVVWALAAWAFLDAMEDIQERNLADGWVITYTPGEGATPIYEGR